MRRYLAIVLRLLLGGVLLYAAYTKLRDPWEVFAMSIAAYGLLPEWAVLVAARTLPWLEVALGGLVIGGYALRYTSLAITGLLGTFLAIMLFSFARGLGIDCGCFGPGEALGPRTFGAREEMVFLGREISEQRNYGEQVARQIDAEIKRIIETAHAKAKEVLTTHRDALDAIANRLIVAESIDGAELAALVGIPIEIPVPLPLTV